MFRPGSGCCNNPTMRIAILNLTGGGVSGGYKRYLSTMLPRLAASPQISEILCASPSSFGVEKWAPATAKVKFTACEPFRFMRHAPDPGLKRALDEFRPDLIFVPIERHLRYRNVPVVTMVQNMGPLSGVKVVSGIVEKAKCLAQVFETRLALKRSAAVIAPTEYVKNFLVRNLGLPAAKVQIINYGSSSVPRNVRPPAGLAPMPGSFVFAAGSLEIYRGLEDLIKAMVPLKTAFPGLKLLLAGTARQATQPYFQELKDLSSRSGVADDVLWLGDLPDEELSWCYQNCSAFAMTSRVESFGFVALEALAHGCNCVSSDSPCLPEIFKDTALYYRPGDSEALAKSTGEILARDPEEREKYKVKAFKRAWQFSWEEAAEKTIRLFTDVSGS